MLRVSQLMSAMELLGLAAEAAEAADDENQIPAGLGPRAGAILRLARECKPGVGRANRRRVAAQSKKRGMLQQDALALTFNRAGHARTRDHLQVKKRLKV